MHASFSSTKNFLSSRGKFKSLHRRKNSSESTATTKSSLRSTSQLSTRPETQSERRPDTATNPPTKRVPPARFPLERPPEVTAPTNVKPVVDVDSLTASQWNQASYDQFTEAQSEKELVSGTETKEGSEPRTSEETMKEVRVQLKPFQGLDYPADLGSNKRLIDDDILKTAFGITLSRGGSADVLKKDIKATDMVKVQVPKSSHNPNDVFEMEVPALLLKDRTPELEVSIPLQRPTPNMSPYQGTLSPIPQSAVSAISDFKSPTIERGTTAQLSVSSPLEVVVSPKPQRPFSTASLQGFANQASEKKPLAPPIKSANSLSSNGTSEQDGKSTGYSHESPRSSMSSVHSDAGLSKFEADIAEATPLRLDTTSLYHAALSTKPSRATSPYHLSSQRPMMHRTGSATSLRSNMTTTTIANVNKPLPPEPGVKRLSTISSIPSEGSSASRSSSITIRQPINPQRNGQILPASSVRAIDVGRNQSTRSSTSAASLRSKYTPKDLDALDDAFLQQKPPSQSRLPKINPPPQHSPLYFPYQSSPNQSQISLARDKALGSISEEASNNFRERQGSTSSDVRQISRGPMRMQPTRRAPQPPKTPQLNTSLSPSSTFVSPIIETPRLTKRSMSSNHIGAQFKEPLDVRPPQRSTTLVVGSSSKADRILGKSPAPSIRNQVQDRHLNPGWTRSESPQNFSSAGPSTTASSQLSSRDETQSPDAERYPADAHVNEIRRRLELLSPKDDPSAIFQAFTQRNAFRSSEALRPQDLDTLNNQIRSEASSRADERSQEYHEAREEPELQAQEFIAELEAPHFPQAPPRPKTPEQVAFELQGSEIPTLVELGLPSPKPLAGFPNVPIPPIPSEDDEVPGLPNKRGRVGQSNPQSTLSAKSRSVHSAGSTRVRSLASLAASEIRDIYAQLPTSQSGSQRPSMSPEEVDMLVSAETAERVLLHILESLGSLGDLFAAAQVSRGFYRTFKRNELPLLKRVLRKTSPAAWELREISVPHEELEEGATDYTPTLYLRHYERDMMTMIELKALILDNCKSFLRQDTISGLAGETERSSAIDEAFWRIWSFCRIFGSGNNREEDIVAQMDWLRGGVLARQNANTLSMVEDVAENSVLFDPPKSFANGNGKEGLSAEELWDMFELWTCLGVLLQGYPGERERARRYGVFEKSNVLQGDAERENAVIDEWTYHLLAKSPSTILDVASFSTPSNELFSRAKSLGHTNWTPPPEGQSRAMFLKEAVSRVYEEKAALLRPAPTPSPRSFSHLPQVVTPSTESSTSDPFNSRQRVAAHAAKIQAKRQEPTFRNTPLSPDRPMSNFNDVLTRLETLTQQNSNEPVPRMPSLSSRFSKRKPKVKVLAITREETESSADSVNASPISNRGNIGNRLTSFRDKVSGRGSSTDVRSKIQVSSPLQQSAEALPTTHEEPLAGPSRQPVRDPIDVAVERLVAMGYDDAKARKALAKASNGDRVDVEKATKLLIKQKKRAERLERLEMMG